MPGVIPAWRPVFLWQRYRVLQEEAEAELVHWLQEDVFKPLHLDKNKLWQHSVPRGKDVLSHNRLLWQGTASSTPLNEPPITPARVPGIFEISTSPASARVRDPWNKANSPRGSARLLASVTRRNWRTLPGLGKIARRSAKAAVRQRPLQQERFGNHSAVSESHDPRKGSSCSDRRTSHENHAQT